MSIISATPPIVQGIAGADGASLDAFGRWRTASPVGLFDSSFRYDMSSALWNPIVVAGGTRTFNINRASMTIASNGAANARYCLRTVLRTHYQPGRSQLVAITFVMGAPVLHTAKRVGYYSNENGVYLQSDATGLSIVLRSIVSGVIVDTPVPQSAWNIDPMNGLGPSGINLDMTKAQLLQIDMQWLGVGRVRVGFNVNGVTYYAHQLLCANVLTSTYMGTASLPVSYEVQTDATGGAAASMECICASVSSEGGFETERGFPFSCSNGSTLVTVNTRRAFLSIRPKATFKGLTNRVYADMIDCSVALNAAGVFLFEIVYNPTFTGAPAWVSVDADSAFEFSVHADVSAGAFTGGYSTEAHYTSAGGRTDVTHSVDSKLPIAMDNNGVQRALSLVGTGAVGGAITVLGSLNWKEIY